MKMFGLILRLWFRSCLILFGGIQLGTFLHEGYHALTLDQVHEACLVFNSPDGARAYVSGVGDSGETVAYAITWTVIGLAFIFAIYDLIKSMMVEVDNAR
jgi:hypothetical protein